MNLSEIWTKTNLGIFLKINKLRAFCGTSERFLSEIKPTSRLWSQRIISNIIFKSLDSNPFQLQNV